MVNSLDLDLDLWPWPSLCQRNVSLVLLVMYICVTL